MMRDGHRNVLQVAHIGYDKKGIFCRKNVGLIRRCGNKSAYPPNMLFPGKISKAGD